MNIIRKLCSTNAYAPFTYPLRLCFVQLPSILTPSYPSSHCAIAIFPVLLSNSRSGPGAKLVQSSTNTILPQKFGAFVRARMLLWMTRHQYLLSLSTRSHRAQPVTPHDSLASRTTSESPILPWQVHVRPIETVDVRSLVFRFLRSSSIYCLSHHVPSLLDVTEDRRRLSENVDWISMIN